MLKLAISKFNCQYIVIMNEQLFILRPSLIKDAGVGCFATTEIPEGTRLINPEEAGTNRKLTQPEIPDSHLKYCPLLESGLFLSPANFAAMSVFWYINHDREANITTDKWRLHAARDIEPEEELTLYYPDLLTHPKNHEWVIPEIHV